MERIGIVGGSGLYELEGIKKIKEVAVTTPFGTPSDKLLLARLEGREIVFLPRHGKTHSINPSMINYRANMYAMKKMGVGWIISVTACGSLKEELKPLDFVIPDQFLDRTTQARKQTFFDDGIVAHIAFAQPVCLCLAKELYACAQQTGVGAHFGGTYVNMEGPQFSTLAESNLYRSWGMDIIGMTNMTEARLAREAQMCYATLAAVTDYDCWHQSHESVTIEMIINNLKKNVSNSKTILKNVVTRIPQTRECGCKNALKYAVITDLKTVSAAKRKKVDLLIKKDIK